MAYSSILGAEIAPQHSSGRAAELLGPSDNSDSGSDTLGTHEAYADSDAGGTGERGSVTPDAGREGGDILPDRIARLRDDEGLPQVDPDTQEFTDLDADGDAGDEVSI